MSVVDAEECVHLVKNDAVLAITTAHHIGRMSYDV